MNRVKTLTKKATTLIFAAVMCSSAVVYAKDSAYATGQKQLDQQNWQAAQKTFTSIVKRKGSKQDAALYWLAYAQFKGNQAQHALNTLKRLDNQFPDSRWVDDAEALSVEIKDKLGDSAEIDDDEMKLYAIDSLLSSNNKKATEILQKILTGNSSNRIKKRAMFVLSQSGDPKAFKAIADIATGKHNETLQLYAIETLGISGAKSAAKLLQEIYQSSSSIAVKRKVLDSFMVADDSATLISLAQSESDKGLKAKAISLIGVMGESTVLVSMYKDKSFAEFKGKILDGIAVGGGAKQLQNIIETETDQKYLVKAIEKMGIVNASKAGPLLVDLYKKRTEKEAKLAVIKALFIQSNDKALLEIVKQEKDPALKRKALKFLSMMDSDEVLDYFSKVLEQGA